MISISNDNRKLCCVVPRNIGVQAFGSLLIVIMSDSLSQNCGFGGFNPQFLFFVLNGFISAFVPHIGLTLSAFLPV
jgi:hypothetical protein